MAICTYPDRHAALAKKALKAGCHIFVENPIATTVVEAQAIIDMANKYNKKEVVGYILRVHPSWKTFIEIPRVLVNHWLCG